MNAIKRLLLGLLLLSPFLAVIGYTAFTSEEFRETAALGCLVIAILISTTAGIILVGSTIIKFLEGMDN